jgi:hypothetical protein
MDTPKKRRFVARRRRGQAPSEQSAEAQRPEERPAAKPEAGTDSRRPKPKHERKRRGPRMRPPGKIRTGHEDHYVGEAPMLRLGRKVVGARSILALNWLVVTDVFTRDIEGLSDKAPELVIDVGGKTIKWQADYAATYVGGRRELVMVRSVDWVEGVDKRSGLTRSEFLAAMETAAAAAGWRFALFTEDQVYVAPRFGNALLASRHGGDPHPKAHDLRAFEAANRLPAGSTVSDLQEAVGNRQDALVSAVRLDLKGMIELDRSEPFTRMSTFAVVTGDAR